MNKTFDELRAIDILPYCETRESKDDKGKTIFVPYLNWAKCVDLLHENGAKIAYFEPVVNEKTLSTLFMTENAFTDKDKKLNRCFEVRVKIVIDDLEFIQNYPLMNGIYVVREDTINQLRLSNAQARAFVKGVAIRTGLGFGLWIKDDETDKPDLEENLALHNILKIKERVERLITTKMDGGLSIDNICEGIGIKNVVDNGQEQIEKYLDLYTRLSKFEKAISEL